MCVLISFHLQGCKKNDYKCDEKEKKLAYCNGPDVWCNQKKAQCTGTQFGCGGVGNAADDSLRVKGADGKLCCPQDSFKCEGSDKDFCDALKKDIACDDPNLKAPEKGAAETPAVKNDAGGDNTPATDTPATDTDGARKEGDDAGAAGDNTPANDGDGEAKNENNTASTANTGKDDDFQAQTSVHRSQESSLVQSSQLSQKASEKADRRAEHFEVSVTHFKKAKASSQESQIAPGFLEKTSRLAAAGRHAPLDSHGQNHSQVSSK